MLNKQKVKGFRSDFEKAVTQLEKDYGVTISLGTIRFDSQELRAKMTAKVGDAPVRASKDDFNIGDIVGINHKKVNPNDEFTIYKINNKNIGVKDSNGAMMRVSPSLLVKK